MMIKPQHCFVCESTFDNPHFFYSQLCVECGDINYTKRDRVENLQGKTALITEAGVKIGLAVALKLLRAGAKVIVTARFPDDAATRYSTQQDFHRWQDRLDICGLDLGNLQSIHFFTQYILDSYSQLDIIINNTAPAIQHQPGSYRNLIPHEALEDRAFNRQKYQQLLTAEIVTQKTQLARILERDRPTIAVDTFVINAHLKKLMLRHPDVDKYIINVAASKGRFKSANQYYHSRATLERITRDRSLEYATHRIFMNCVDPEWYGFEELQSPFDIIDAAARICDPIYTGIKEAKHTFGKLFKNYLATEWG